MESCRENGSGFQGRVDAYDAVKQQLLAAQRVRYASLSFVQEQRRLRIHLRRILLVNGAFDDKPEPPNAQKQARHSIANDQLRQWKDDAIARENQRQRRLTSVNIIQTYVRRWLASRQNRELPSSSEFIAFSIADVAPLAAIGSPRRFTEPTRSPVGAWAPDLRSSSFEPITEPFQVIAELLGARDLVFPPGIQGDATAEVLADVQLLHQPGKTVLGRFETPPLSVTVVSSDGIQWDGQVLQIGVDPLMLAAECVITECVVTVDVFARRPGVVQTVSLGRLGVAMDLLETPLADKYAMTRWFPLERSSGGGRPARGEVHLSLRFLMRNPEPIQMKRGDEEEDVWVPYIGNAVAAAEQSPSPPPVRRRVSTTLTRRRSSTATKKGAAAAKPPLSPRRDGEVPMPQAKNRVASPVRYRKVEVISPPSSPSSYSSDSNAMDEASSPQKSPSPRAHSSIRRQSSGGIVASAAARARRSSIRDTMMTKASKTVETEEGDTSPQKALSEEGASPKKPFLKRKPYKVVFQKLDWSRVGAKTDSGTGAKGAVSPVRTGTQATPQLASGGSGGTTGAVAAPPVIERLVSVVDAVNAACKVTTQTAPLAQMKYKGERKKFLTALPVKPVDQPADPSALASVASSVSDEALQLLWTELHADVDGAIYAKRLADLLV